MYGDLLGELLVAMGAMANKKIKGLEVRPDLCQLLWRQAA